MARLRLAALLSIAPALLSSAALARSSRPKLALLPVEAVNLAPGAARALGALLERRLAATRAFTLIGPRQTGPLVGERACESRCAQRVGRRLGAARLLRFEAARLGATRVLRLTLIETRRGARVGSWQEVLAHSDNARTAAALDRMIHGFAPRPRRRARRPWYGRWWVWTAVAGAVAAGAITAVVLATRDGGPAPDYVFRPPAP